MPPSESTEKSFGAYGCGAMQNLFFLNSITHERVGFSYKACFIIFNVVEFVGDSLSISFNDLKSGDEFALVDSPPTHYHTLQGAFAFVMISYTLL